MYVQVGLSLFVYFDSFSPEEYLSGFRFCKVVIDIFHAKVKSVIILQSLQLKHIATNFGFQQRSNHFSICIRIYVHKK